MGSWLVAPGGDHRHPGFDSLRSGNRQPPVEDPNKVQAAGHTTGTPPPPDPSANKPDSGEAGEEVKPSPKGPNKPAKGDDKKAKGDDKKAKAGDGGAKGGKTKPKSKKAQRPLVELGIVAEVGQSREQAVELIERVVVNLDGARRVVALI